MFRAEGSELGLRIEFWGFKSWGKGGSLKGFY